MENLSLLSAGSQACAVCNSHVPEADAFCTSCGYPVKGTETEQQYFISERNAREIDLESFQKAVNVASRTLFVIATFTAAFGVILYFVSSQNHTDQFAGATLVVNLILAALYLGLGLWSKSKPVAALISGLSLYLIVQVVSAIGNPMSLATGIILKIIYIGYFIKGIKSAMEAERVRKQYNM